MSQFGELYARYYDLLYIDKDYKKEADYIDSFLKEEGGIENILDLGCGTGRHAELLCDRGYRICGVDLSLEMLSIAEKRRSGREERLKFVHSDIHELDLDHEFDAVTSLFHVMSYQNSNDELINTFEVVKRHLKSNGIFIFDFWYGPAVLTDPPSVRVKRLENETIKVTRIAEPVLHIQKNLVDVNYDIFIEDKKTGETAKKNELHRMRYLFDTELTLVLSKIGFEVVSTYEWQKTNKPNLSSWNVVWIVRKKY